MTEEDEYHYKNTNIRRNCEKNSNKFRDHCYLTGKDREPAHCNCNINVTKKLGNFIPFVFQKYISLSVQEVG